MSHATTFWRVCGGATSVALVSIALSGTGLASAARREADSILGHPVTSTPKPGAILTLGRDGKFPASAIPTVASARSATTARSARTAKTVTNAKTLGGQTLAQLVAGCPTGTANLGTYCMMVNPYPIATAQEGQNDFAFATQACEAIGGYLPDAGELIGAAKAVKLESTINDNPSTATVQGSDGNGPELDQREMSSSLITTQAGSDAAGSEGVTPGAHPDPSSGQPDPTPQPAVPYPATLQYITVYSNGTKGGFAGSEPVGTAENFRCAFDLRQTASTSSTSTTTPTKTSKKSTKKGSSTSKSVRDVRSMMDRQADVLRRSLAEGRSALSAARR